MEEIVPYHFILQRCKRVLDVSKVADVQPIPVYKVSTALPALPAFFVGHLLQRSKAMQITLAVRRRALDVELRRFLKLENSDFLNSGHDQSEIDRSHLRCGKDAAQRKHHARRSRGLRLRAEGWQPHPTS